MEDKSPPTVRIGLLTPHSGNNLGDAAIQTALIANFRRRFVGAEMIMVTLDPEATSRLHGTPSVPLRSWPVRSKWLWAPQERDTVPADGRAARPSNPPAQPRLEPGRLRRTYWMLARSLSRARAEIGHIRRTLEFVKSLDCLVVGGGGQINEYWGGPFAQPYALLKWSLSARRNNVPVVVMGVGVGTISNLISRVFIRIALGCSARVSVRDSGSISMLRRLAPKIPYCLVPDVAFSAQVEHRKHSAGDGNIRSGPVRVGLSPIGYLDPRVWPKKDQDAYDAHNSMLAELACKLLDDGHRLVLFTSTTAMDRLSLEDLAERIKRKSPKSEFSIVEPATPGALMQLAASLDVAVASRLHGILLCHLCRLPVLALSYDRKVDAHMEAMEQSEYCLPLVDSTAGQIHDRLIAILEFRQSTTDTIDRIAIQNAAALDAEYDAICGLVDGGTSPVRP